MTEVLRTPHERFAGLPGAPCEPRYAEIDDGDGGRLRVARLDEGPADAPVVLLLHGEPSWSYLYRTTIPGLLDAGFQVVAPDLVGLGRSDKPALTTVILPTAPDDPETPANRAAWQAPARWEKPSLCAFSDSDPITGAVAPVLQRVVPGAAGQPHTTITDAGHFLQEDAGPDLAGVVVDWLAR